MTDTIRVLGYHGTSRVAAASILSNGFQPSINPYDWLGDGIYFWQDAPARAWEWAREQHGLEAAVIEARICLEDCIDLLDITWARFLADSYNSYLAQVKATNQPLPRQTSGAHRLDREVINYVAGVLADKGVVIRSVRAPFREGNPLFPNSALYDRAHVQIAVRDSSMLEEPRLVFDTEAIQP